MWFHLVLKKNPIRNRDVDHVHHLDLGRASSLTSLHTTIPFPRRIRKPPPTRHQCRRHPQSRWFIRQFAWGAIYCRNVGREGNAKCGGLRCRGHGGNFIAGVATLGRFGGSGKYQYFVESFYKFGVSSLVDEDGRCVGPAFIG